MVFSLFLMIFTQKNASCVVLTPKWQLANIFLLRISMQSEWKITNSNCRIVIYVILFSIFFHNFAQYFENEHQGDLGRRRRTRFQPGNENGKKEKVFGLWRSGKVEIVVLLQHLAVKLFARSTAPTFPWAVLYSISKNNWLISLTILLIRTKIVFPMFFHCFGENKLNENVKVIFFNCFQPEKYHIFNVQNKYTFWKQHIWGIFFLKVRTLHFKTLNEILIYTENWLRYDFFSEILFFIDFHRNKLL